jgi:hypothetical protein
MTTRLLPFFGLFVALQTNGQEQNQMQQYYHFESSCSIVYTTNKSTILTLYADSSFSIEIFSNKRGGEHLYTQSRFSGKWNRKNDTLSFQYLNKEVHAIACNGEMVTTFANSLLQLPVFCIIAGDAIITNSNYISNLHATKNKAVALNEKWAFENEQRKTESAVRQNNFTFGGQIVQ